MRWRPRAQRAQPAALAARPAPMRMGGVRRICAAMRPAMPPSLRRACAEAVNLDGAGRCDAAAMLAALGDSGSRGTAKHLYLSCRDLSAFPQPSGRLESSGRRGRGWARPVSCFQHGKFPRAATPGERPARSHAHRHPGYSIQFRAEQTATWKTRWRSKPTRASSLAARPTSAAAEKTPEGCIFSRWDPKPSRVAGTRTTARTCGSPSRPADGMAVHRFAIVYYRSARRSTSPRPACTADHPEQVEVQLGAFPHLGGTPARQLRAADWRSRLARPRWPYVLAALTPSNTGGHPA